MKLFLKIFLLLLSPVLLKAQTQPFRLDSLLRELRHSANDSVRMNLYDQLGWYYAEINRDSALSYFEKQLPIARKLKLEMYEADALNGMGYILIQLGNYPKALESLLEAQKIARNPAIEKNAWNLTNNAWNTSKSPNPKDARLNLLGWIHNSMGVLYRATGNTNNAISNYFEAKNLASFVRDTTLLEVTNSTLGGVYLILNKLDSALLFQQTALFLYKTSDVFRKYEGGALWTIGIIYQQKGDLDLAKDAFLESVKVNMEQENLSGLAWSYLSLANLYETIKKTDSSMLYARKALRIFNDMSLPSGLSDTYHLVSSIYAKHNKPDSAYAYLKLSAVIKDSLNNAERATLLAFKNKDFAELLRLKELEDEKVKTKTKIRTFALLAGIGVFSLITLLLYRNNKLRKKANALLQEQKEEIEIQKKNVEGTLAELKATQVQLIQAEKMASLGELTAGIAHEIQNPLNFINNFSEVNTELIKEIQDKRHKPKDERDEELENELLKDIVQNQEKVLYHGKRADAIVKGMLQHSRSSSGQKELTDINLLCNEYLRLSYHGLRAKDKSFNTKFETHLDPTLPKINVVPQDIGRVILNLINNAFYAVNEKGKSETSNVKESSSYVSHFTSHYEPLVTVSTKNLGDQIQISVKDNGPGIPDHIKEKIFQPFFTTKPTGQGTGLGLSLSYDIVKAHGGELKADSREGQGSEFNITLPTV